MKKALLLGVFILVGPFSLLLAIVLATIAYLAVLLATGAQKMEDMESVLGLIPSGRVKGWLGVG